MKLQVALLGRMDYMKALEIQEKYMNLRIEDKVVDTLLLVEHAPVLTLGRRGKTSNILVPEETLKSQGVNIYEVSRGGDITYHGPGQVVGYPIIHLGSISKDIKKFVWNIEETFIQLLKCEYNISAHREDGKYTGVWVGNEKITAIGIHVKHWVTMHGFAFNVNTRLEHFNWINPCGITDKGVTSLQKILGQPMNFDYLNALVIKYFSKAFKYEPQIISLEDVYRQINL